MFNLPRLAPPFAIAMLAALALDSPARASAMLVVETATATTDITAEEIDAFEQVTVRTRNDFTDGVETFEGPLAREVLHAAGASLEGTGRFIAANDYVVEIPLAELVEYDVIFATSMNGVRFSLRDKGPIWVIYPMSDHAELGKPDYNPRLIWQLVRIELD